MKKEISARSINFILVAVHCITGNVVGLRCDHTFLQIIFFPFSYIAGFSDYAGWSSLSYILEIAGIAVMLAVLYPFALLIKMLLERRPGKTTS